jgi:hypothetical protein
MEKETISIVFRIEKNLKTAFDHIAQKRDLTVSQMLRAYIRSEVENDSRQNTQKDLFIATTPPKPLTATTPPKKTKKATSAAAGMFKQMKKGVF